MNFRFLKMPTERESLEEPFSLSVLGEREVSLVPCRRVVTYEDALVRVETAGCIVAVKGEGLTMQAYHGKELRITGRIDTLAIERGK